MGFASMTIKGAPPLRKLFQTRLTLHSTRVRFSSSEQKHVSPHVDFYKTFGRPIAKVFLMATFTYQLAYWFWVKLERDETRVDRQTEISSLETKLKDVIDAQKRP